MGGQNSRIPLAVKLAFTAFAAILVPYYWQTYGPTNFLYFCDVALLMTLAALWLESSLLASAACVGILLPQVFWQVDFLAQVAGLPGLGLTGYMFDSQLSLFARGLSFFHFWLPLLLLWAVSRTGYDRRGLAVWTVLASCLIVVCYFWMPPPPASADTPHLPVNINYVFGLDSDAPQTWMAPGLYVTLMLVGLPLLVFYPTHLLLGWCFPQPAEPCGQTADSPGDSPGDSTGNIASLP